MRLKHRQAFGYSVVAASVLITLLLWIGSRWYFDEWYDDPFLYVAKLGSLPATLLMCWAFVFSTRFFWVRWLFGGLDKVYAAHAKIGKITFFVLLLHPIFLAMHRLPDVAAYFSYLWFSPQWVRNTGIIALVLFTLLVVMTISVKVAYHRWKITHNFFGLVLLLVIWHIVLADGDITRYPLLRFWFTSWLLLALASYVYIRVLYRFFGPLYDYTVIGNESRGDVMELILAPANPHRRMKHQPAQFAYVAFRSPHIGPESHPYTVSSPPGTDHLRMSIKALGDYTNQLHKVQPGTRAEIWGPYGYFSDYLFEHPGKESVFIAGGIGITPFLSILEDELFQKHDQRMTCLYYCMEA
jgi:predicted ferric reductase